MKIFLKFLLIFNILIVIVFFIWYLNIGNKNLYYIEELNMYIKTFPSRRYTTIAFSDKKIKNLSDTLDYVIVHKGDNYSTSFLFDPNKKNMIYDANSNSISQIHMVKYELDKIARADTIYYNREGSKYLLKLPYIKLNFYICGTTEELKSKNRENSYWTEIKPVR
ncbi:hypothetical protein FACS1894176_03080 [Bacteroidia bacterium]|nr:hypothetical protein FACS1894176_03080 [Bacteroidia bacterium]